MKGWGKGLFCDWTLLCEWNAPWEGRGWAFFNLRERTEKTKDEKKLQLSYLAGRLPPGQKPDKQISNEAL